MTDCLNSPDPTAITLVFGGTTLGDFVHSMTPGAVEALDQIAKRSNYWSNKAILDGRYRAFVFPYNFSVYVEKDNRFQYAQLPYSYTSLMRGSAQTLELKYAGNTVMWFGPCLLDSVRQKNPEELLLYEAGVLEFNFLGTEVPSVI